MLFRLISYILLTAVLAGSLFSCTKKGDFINEGALGGGVHYYPVVLHSGLFDTLTRQYLNLRDTVFSPGQEVIVELDYYSQDSVHNLQLWAGKALDKLDKALDASVPPSLSHSGFIDTVLFRYTLPAGIDSLSDWYIQPVVITKHGLQGSVHTMLRIR